MRAMSDSAELARLTGIKTENVVKATWVLGASLAAAAGVFKALAGECAQAQRAMGAPRS